MSDQNSDGLPINNRLTELYKSIIESKGINDHTWGLDALLDVLVFLYEECVNSSLRNEKCISDFIGLAAPFVSRIRSSRVSKHDFDLVKTIGRGAFGDVVVAKLRHQKSCNSVYAVKIMSKNEMLNREDCACFREEQQLLMFGDKNWITKMHFSFQDNDNLYFVMDYYAGGDLLTLLSKYEQFSEYMAKYYCAEISIALQSIHSLGYIHRDVKPENVLLDRNGHVRLGDFGSALKIPIGPKSPAKVAVGTPDYISPEILQAMESGKGIYGVECDWWSLGCTLWEMLFGLPPFFSNSLVETYGKIMRHVQYDMKLSFPADISDDCKDILNRLLSPSEKRIGTNNGLDEIREHAFFSDLNFETIKTCSPPYIPEISGLFDTSNFDVDEIGQRRALGGVDMSRKTHLRKGLDAVFSGHHLPFVGFTYCTQQNDESQLKCELQCNASVQASDEQMLKHAEKLQESLLSDLDNEIQIRSCLRNITQEMSKSLGELMYKYSKEDGSKKSSKWQQDRNAKAVHMKLQEMEVALKHEQESKTQIQCELRQVKADNVVKSVQIESLSDTIDKLQKQIEREFRQYDDSAFSDHVHDFEQTGGSFFYDEQINVCSVCRSLILFEQPKQCLYCDKIAHSRCESLIADEVVLKGQLILSCQSRSDVHTCVITRQRLIIFEQNSSEMYEPDSGYRVFDRCDIVSVHASTTNEHTRTRKAIHGNNRSMSNWRVSSNREVNRYTSDVRQTSVIVDKDQIKSAFYIVLHHPLKSNLNSTELNQISFIIESEKQRDRWINALSTTTTTKDQNLTKAWRVSNRKWKGLRCALIIDTNELWIGSEEGLWILRSCEQASSVTASLKKSFSRRTMQLAKLNNRLVLALVGRNRSVRILQRPIFTNDQSHQIINVVTKLAKNVNTFILTEQKLYLFCKSQTFVVFDRNEICSTSEPGIQKIMSINLFEKSPPIDFLKCFDVHEPFDQSDEVNVVIGMDHSFKIITFNNANLKNEHNAIVTGEPLGSVLLNQKFLVLLTKTGAFGELVRPNPLCWPSLATAFACNKHSLFVCCALSGIHLYVISDVEVDERFAVLQWTQTLPLCNSIPLHIDGSLFVCSPVYLNKNSNNIDVHQMSNNGNLLIYVAKEKSLFTNSSNVDISLPADFRHISHIGADTAQSIVQTIDDGNERISRCLTMSPSKSNSSSSPQNLNNSMDCSTTLKTSSESDISSISNVC